MPASISVGPLGVNVYFLPFGEDECVVFDPGADVQAILREIRAIKLIPRLVVLTHGHLDHSAGIPALMAAFVSQGLSVPLAIHAADACYLGTRAEETNRRVFADIHAQQYFDRFFVPLPEPDIVLEDGNCLPGTDIKVIHTPGHSRGSCCFYRESSGELISGDTLFQAGIGRTDAFDADEIDLRVSIRERLFVLPDETEVFPGHGESTSIRTEKFSW